jgi:hypothetical protein
MYRINDFMIQRRVRLLVGLWLAALAAGCGYNTQETTEVAGYQWRTVYRTDVRTVAVPIFTNRDFHRGYEFQITNALIHRIEAFTPYKVVSRDHADTILEGEIVSIKNQPINISQLSATPQQQLLRIVVNFTWKDLRTGKILVEEREFEQTDSYYPTLGEGPWVGEQNAAEKLAGGIVDDMQAPW